MGKAPASGPDGPEGKTRFLPGPLREPGERGKDYWVVVE
jgi:hypothetical protein